ELKRHQFFSDIEWEALSKKLITPPFKPKIMSETDTSNFGPEFNKLVPQLLISQHLLYRPVCKRTLRALPSSMKVR
ncbi:hypothetical protein DL98DRAFT_438724, partial [Cadophora sp. DSE1049]